MTGTAFLPTDFGAALELQALTDTWGDDPLTPAKAHRLELLVVRAVQLATGLKLAWTICSRDGSVWETRPYAHRIRAIEFLAATVVDVLTRTQEIVVRTRRSHPEWTPPPVAAELPANLPAAQDILAQAQKLSDWLSRDRAPVDEDMIRQSRASLDRGEGEALSEIIARLQNGGDLVKE